jgi:hypothetical protein
LPPRGRAPASAALQRRVRAGVVAPEPPEGAASVLRALPGLTPEASLEIYREGWLARLRRILAGDFPAVEAALGERRFTAAAAAYLRARPPGHPNIARAGEGFAAWIESAGSLPHRGALADLARLEWAVTSSFDHPDGPTLRPEHLEGMDPGAVAASRFAPAPGCFLLELGRDLDPWRRAARRGERRPWPPPRRATVALVSRPAERVAVRALPGAEARLLRDILGGAPLGEALFAAEARDGVAAARVTAWFRRWVEAAVLAPPTAPRPSPSRRPSRQGASSTRRRGRGSAPAPGRSPR